MMATMLNIRVEELANKILSHTSKPEERFVSMKKFYTFMYPKSVEFYEKFSRKKKRKTSSAVETRLSSTPKKLKPDSALSDNNVDYYDNLNSFENVLDLIDEKYEQHSSVDNSESKTSSAKVEIAEKSRNTDKNEDDNDIDKIFEKFMNSGANRDAEENIHSTLQVEELSALKESLNLSSNQNDRIIVRRESFLTEKINSEVEFSVQNIFKDRLEEENSINPPTVVKDKYDSFFDDLEKEVASEKF